MATLTLGQVVTAVIVMIVIGLTFGIIKGMTMNDIFSAMGILEEENIGDTNIPTSSKYITLIKTNPKEIAEDGGIFPKDENDWVGTDQVRLKNPGSIQLIFDKKIKLTDEEQNAWTIVNKLEDIDIDGDTYSFDKVKNIWKNPGLDDISKQEMVWHLLTFANLRSGQHSYDENNGWQLVNLVPPQRNEKTLDCIHVYESQNGLLRPDPNKRDEWRFRSSASIPVFIEEKTITVRKLKEGGFPSDYFYMIWFTDCFKGETVGDNEVPLNPQSGIVKFSVK
jgi:hypothetical protein